MLLGITAIAGLVLESAFVLTVLWHWFIVPFGIQPIDMGWALGLMSIASLLTVKTISTSDDDFGPNAAANFFHINLVFAVGFIAHLFM